MVYPGADLGASVIKRFLHVAARDRDRDWCAGPLAVRCGS